MSASTARKLAVLAALVLLPVLVGHGAPGLLDDSRALILVSGCVLVAAALSLNLLMGYCGQISLGHYTLLGFGAFAAAIMTGPLRQDQPFLVGLVVAMLVGAAVAFVIGLPALRLRGLYLAVVTIGFAFATEAALFKIKRFTGGSAGVETARPYFGSHALVRNADYLAVALAILWALWQLDVNITRTKLGRAFQAIRADEGVAASYGIDPAGYKLLAFTLSGAVAGAAGAIYAGKVGTVAGEAFGFDQSLSLVIVVVLGGLGSRVGVVSAAVGFTLFPQLLVKLFGESGRGWDLVVGSLLLVVAIADQPGGVAAGIREAREKAERKRELAAAGGDELLAAKNQPTMPEMPRPKGLTRKPSVPRGTALLTVTDVSVSFGGLQAVDRASFQVTRGTICGLIGPNGAGKSTLFNVVSGLQRPDEGQVVFAGYDITAAPPYARAMAGIGRTFQLIGLAKDLSVTENLMLAQHVVASYSVPEALGFVGRAPRLEREMRQRARDAVHALGFDQYADTPVKNLSHGQQRIVEIGCTLVTAPELVMLDEPSAGMSPGAAENLALRLADIRDQLGRTVLLIEHNIPLVLDVADELVVLAAGKVIADGEPLAVVERQDVVEAYLGRGYDQLDDRTDVLEAVR